MFSSFLLLRVVVVMVVVVVLMQVLWCWHHVINVTLCVMLPRVLCCVVLCCVVLCCVVLCCVVLCHIYYVADIVLVIGNSSSMNHLFTALVQNCVPYLPTPVTHG